VPRAQALDQGGGELDRQQDAHRDRQTVLEGQHERREIKDILSYLRLLVHPTDEIALDRVKKIGKQRFAKFKSFYETYKESKKSFWLDMKIIIETFFVAVFR